MRTLSLLGRRETVQVCGLCWPGTGAKCPKGNNILHLCLPTSILDTSASSNHGLGFDVLGPEDLLD